MIINVSFGKGVDIVISYKPLWKTMEKQNETTYTLIHHHGINPRTIYNLKHNGSITMYTLERLCQILNCTPNEIVLFEKEA